VTPPTDLASSRLVFLGTPTAWAVFSMDSLYRYLLYRDHQTPLAPKPIKTRVWCMLNPSTATHEVLDPTIRKCIKYDKRDGFTGTLVVNMCAYRATDPKELLVAKDPLGDWNDRAIEWACLEPLDSVVCAWGRVHKSLLRFAQRAEFLTRCLRACPLALAVNDDGSPCHPLYLKDSLPLRPLEELREEKRRRLTA